MDPFDYLRFNIPHTAGMLQNEPGYPSTSREARNVLDSPPKSCELKYLEQKNAEKSLHKKWMIQQVYLEKMFQKKIGEDIKVESSVNRVKFIYKYKTHEVLGETNFQFKIILLYRNLLRKWYLSSGYSFVPEAIDLKSKFKTFKSGTYHPLSTEVLNIIKDVRCEIDVFMARLTTVHQFVEGAKKRHKDMQFFMNAIVTKMKLTFMENAWPNGLLKLSLRDIIVVKLELDKDLQVSNATYEYTYQKPSPIKYVDENLKKLGTKMQYFFDFPLEEAFEKFITEAERSLSLQENSLNLQESLRESASSLREQKSFSSSEQESSTGLLTI